MVTLREVDRFSIYPFYKSIFWPRRVITPSPPPPDARNSRPALKMLLLAGVLGSLIRILGSPGSPDPVSLEDRLGRLRIDLNRGGETDLLLLPGIGPERAHDIVEDRARRGPFDDLKDLSRVPGIGASTLEALKDSVRFGAATDTSLVPAALRPGMGSAEP